MLFDSSAFVRPGGFMKKFLRILTRLSGLAHRKEMCLNGAAIAPADTNIPIDFFEENEPGPSNIPIEFFTGNDF